MDSISYNELPELFQGVADLFAEKKDELCEMDARMGDGDLGLTMQKGYGALPQLIRENGETGNIGKTLMKAGMKMAGLVPSTMGTLMASGIMEGGRALAGKEEIGPKEMAEFLTAFARGIQKRGKCQLGDRTILDSVDAGARKAEAASQMGENIAAVILAAAAGAKEGVEATKEMLPKYGKAAVFSAKAKGVPDQGAVAGQYFFEGLAKYFDR
ncbi:dihydroxyacetone kinase subunit L [Clostridium sp. AM58-1XD]|uniref:dihydroxyacetone kinase subunit L n=1 Tax=Clostridium sp. AM58-1XD TaxID=2292307 RepID=UPI000E51420D|nr:dihydroxyacetone kinase subunit L [Clostridium sp. AM58-1XD]RGY99612.1 DAK2 domain-containing protein [Clostridium sp. AM58-1XD]